MTRQRLRILYEDRLGAASEFPLHRLVLNAAHDDCPAVSRWQLDSTVAAIPKKGRDEVLKELQHVEKHFHYGANVLAWLDNDRVRDPFTDARSSTPKQMVARLRAGRDRDRVKIFLLEDNLESLFRSVEQDLDPALRARLYEKAVRKRGLDARDQLLLAIANSKPLRSLLRARHRGFDCVARYVAAIATLEPWPFAPTPSAP